MKFGLTKQIQNSVTARKSNMISFKFKIVDGHHIKMFFWP